MMNEIISAFRGKYFFLSNFSLCSMKIEKHTYPSVEHYFQSKKALLKYDEDFIRSSETPMEAKRRGRQVKIKENWESIKKEVMLKALNAKFKIPRMRIKLLNTEKAYLIEENLWHDNIWGDCKCNNCKKL